MEPGIFSFYKLLNYRNIIVNYKSEFIIIPFIKPTIILQYRKQKYNAPYMQYYNIKHSQK